MHDLGASTLRQIIYMYVINQIKEKCREYNIPLSFAFVDYQNAFYSPNPKQNCKIKEYKMCTFTSCKK